jgi:hypothetical protein
MMIFYIFHLATFDYPGNKPDLHGPSCAKQTSCDSQDSTYTVLATNAFNSARKRMSVLVKKGWIPGSPQFLKGVPGGCE